MAESGYERVQKVFWTRERKASCTGASRGCTGAKELSEGARDSRETFSPWYQKPCAPSRNHFGEFPFSLFQVAWFATLHVLKTGHSVKCVLLMRSKLSVETLTNQNIEKCCHWMLPMAVMLEMRPSETTANNSSRIQKNDLTAKTFFGIINLGVK